MLKTIPVVEIFGNDNKVALQGEGKFAGCPSVFLRVFGCNLRCEFGLQNQKPETRRQMLNELVSYSSKFTENTLNELPIVAYGCDSYYAIYPEYRRYSKAMTQEEIVDELNFKGRGENKTHLVITGGEPLLPGYQDFWAELIPKLEAEKGLETVTFETNATYPLTEKFKRFLDESYHMNIHLSMSPKISPNSGMPSKKTWNIPAVDEYIDLIDSWFKFVVGNESDMMEVEKYLGQVDRFRSTPVYLMAEGATQEEFDKNQKIVYNLACKYGYRYSPRLHISAAGGGIGV